MKNILLILTLLIIAITTLGKDIKEGKHKENYNILFLMDDQHRGDYVGASGNNWIYTPNIDKLAKEGILFAKGYCSVPSCLPARASILTGKSPWEHGMLTYTDIPDSYKDEMPRMLRDYGYYTISIGKNHFINASLKEPKTVTHGYQKQYLEESWRSKYPGVDPRNCDYTNWFHANFPNKDRDALKLSYIDHRGGRYYPFSDSLHATHWTADRAIEFIENYKEDKPWFMKVSFQRPHPPFDPPKRWLDFYDNRNIPEAKVGSWASKRYQNLEPDSLENHPNRRYGKYPNSEVVMARKTYAAAISFVDEQIGHILEALKEKGELKNTFILFTSDHGDMMGDQHMWAKCRPYEPSVHVPFIVRWPEHMNLHVKRDQIRYELVELRDILPTFLDVAGISQPDDMDGSSILDIVRGTGDWRTILDFEHGQIYEKDNAWTALTDGRFKYIYFTLTGEQQLFDLRNDPHELIDISKNTENKELLIMWRNRMMKHLSSRGEPWIKDGDLNIQKKSVKWRPGYPEALQ